MNWSWPWPASRRRLLYLDAQSLSVYRWQAGELHGEGDFAADPSGAEDFAAYLARNPKHSFCLLADVADEGFHRDTLPPVSGREREVLLRRKFAQHFSGTQLITALSLGRETSGRRDEKILCAALTRPQAFDSWLTALRQHECQFSGLYSMPLLADRFAASCLGNFNSDHPQFLLIVQTRAGLRQFYFENGRMQFSRLSPLTLRADSKAEDLASACALETGRMEQYLLGQRKVVRGVTLPVLLLIDPAAAEQLRDAGSPGNDIHYEFIGISDLAGKVGIRKLPPESRCRGELLFLPLLMRRPPRQQFAPAVERLFHRMWQARLVLNGVGLTILLACLLFSSLQWLEVSDLREQTARTRQQVTDSEEKYAAIFGALPPLPLSSTDLRILIDSYDDLTRHSDLPETLYAFLSSALQQAEQIELERIDWRAAGVGAGQGDAVDESGEIADVHAELPLAYARDPRATQEAIDQFVAALSKNTGLQVRILKLPEQSEFESTNSLQGGHESAANGATNLAAPKFSLRLHVKPATS